MVDVSPRQVEVAAALYGAAGRAWAAALPAELDRLARRWRLRLGSPYPATYSWTAPACRDDGRPVVVKAVFPGSPEWATELATLRLAAGRGYPDLYDVDEAAGAALLERVRPGTPLAMLAARDDDAATVAAADVMARVWLPMPGADPAAAGLPTVQRWGAGFARHRATYGGSGPLAAELFDRAERVFAELVASQAAPVVLHGDLHHDNVLADHRDGWRAIDPKGVVGEPAYEVGALLRNPPGVERRPDLRSLLRRRVDLLAERLGLDPARLAAWGGAQDVLSAVWLLEDTGERDPDGLRVAAALLR